MTVLEYPKMEHCPPKRGQGEWPKIWSASLLLMVWFIVAAINAPGHLSFDSIDQIAEGRQRVYDGHHPPIMSFLLGIFDRVLPGTALYMLFVQSFFFLPLVMIILRAPKVSWWHPALLLLISSSPLVFLYQGIIWKDVLFANLMVCAFAVLWYARSSPRLSRFMIYILSLILGGIAAQVRQNGGIVLPILGVTLLWVETINRVTFGQKLKTILLGTIIGLFVFFVLNMAVKQLINSTAVGVPRNSFEVGLSIVTGYDLAAFAASPEVDLSFLKEHGVNVDLLRGEAQKFYTPERVDTLNAASLYGRELNKLSLAQRHSLWLRLLIRNPGTYLRHRLTVYAWMMWPPPNVFQCLPIHIGIEGSKALILSLGLQEGVRSSDRALVEYSKPFFYTPVFNHFFYLAIVVAFACAGMLFPRNINPAQTGLCLGAVAFSTSWLAFGIACDFRYMYFLALSASFCVLANCLTFQWRASVTCSPSCPRS